MIVVQNRIPVAEGYEDQFLDRFRTRRGLVDGQPGFIRNVVLRPIKGEHFIVLTFWETEEQFRACDGVVKAVGHQVGQPCYYYKN